MQFSSPVGYYTIHTLRIWHAHFSETTLAVTVGSICSTIAPSIMAQPLIVALCVSNKIMYPNLDMNVATHNCSLYSTTFRQLPQRQEDIRQTIVLILQLLRDDVFSLHPYHTIN